MNLCGETLYHVKIEQMLSVGRGCNTLQHWMNPTGHTTLLLFWINVNDVDATLQQLCVPVGMSEKIHVSMIILQSQCNICKWHDINILLNVYFPTKILLWQEIYVFSVTIIKPQCNFCTWHKINVL